ncbi:MAG: hypothetical protein PPP56_06445 [Longimonas sp.]|uniref:hypothetical protein n=1 Tax=Longimonas sp. TaxID=2039626 RepID=UPI00335BCA7A
MPRPRSSRSRRRGAQPPVLQPINYKLLLASVLSVVLGFTLMYIEGALEGTLSLYISPLMLMGGYMGVIYALLYMPGVAEEQEETG